MPYFFLRNTRKRANGGRCLFLIGDVWCLFFFIRSPACSSYRGSACNCVWDCASPLCLGLFWCLPRHSCSNFCPCKRKNTYIWDRQVIIIWVNFRFQMHAKLDFLFIEMTFLGAISISSSILDTFCEISLELVLNNCDNRHSLPFHVNERQRIRSCEDRLR